MAESAESYPTIRDFVFQDAQEKAFQIHLRGIKEYQVEKKRIYNERMDEVTAEADKKLKQQLIQKKIYKSSLINHARMDKMVLRNDLIMSLISIAQHNIFEMITSDKQKYKKLLKQLIIESMIDLFEQKVIVRCLQRDVSLVQQILPECKRQYEALLLKELGFTTSVEIILNNGQYLLERNVQKSEPIVYIPQEIGDKKPKKMTQQQLIQKAEEDLKCFGGVLLTTEDKLITSKNTLDARIDLVYSKFLPQIREKLFN